MTKTNDNFSFGMSFLEQKNNSLAAKHFAKAAEEGDAAGQCFLAFAYFNGWNTLFGWSNTSKAWKWATLSVEQNYPAAYIMQGFLSLKQIVNNDYFRINSENRARRQYAIQKFEQAFSRSLTDKDIKEFILLLKPLSEDEAVGLYDSYLVRYYLNICYVYQNSNNEKALRDFEEAALYCTDIRDEHLQRIINDKNAPASLKQSALYRYGVTQAYRDCDIDSLWKVVQQGHKRALESLKKLVQIKGIEKLLILCYLKLNTDEGIKQAVEYCYQESKELEKFWSDLEKKDSRIVLASILHLINNGRYSDAIQKLIENSSRLDLAKNAPSLISAIRNCQDKKAVPELWHALGWCALEQKETKIAIEYFIKSAQTGYSGALQELEKLDIDKDTQNVMGECYFSRKNATQEDYKKAVQFFIASDTPRAKKNLRFCLWYGKGIQKNQVRVMDDVRENKSIVVDNAKVQNEIGESLLAIDFSGRIITEDERKKAVQYFTASVEGKNSIASRNLARCYRDGNGVEKNTEYAKKLEEATQPPKIIEVSKFKAILLPQLVIETQDQEYGNVFEKINNL